MSDSLDFELYKANVLEQHKVAVPLVVKGGVRNIDILLIISKRSATIESHSFLLFIVSDSHLFYFTSSKSTSVTS